MRKQINVDLSDNEELYNKISSMADEDDRSLAQTLKVIIKEYFAKIKDGG